MKIDTSFYEKARGKPPGGLGFFHFSLDFPATEAGSRIVFFAGKWSECLQRALDAAAECRAQSLTVLA